MPDKIHFDFVHLLLFPFRTEVELHGCVLWEFFDDGVNFFSVVGNCKKKKIKEKGRKEEPQHATGKHLDYFCGHKENKAPNYYSLRRHIENLRSEIVAVLSKSKNKNETKKQEKRDESSQVTQRIKFQKWSIKFSR